MELPILMDNGQKTKPEDIPAPVARAVLKNMTVEEILLLDTRFSKTLQPMFSSKQSFTSFPKGSKAFKHISVFKYVPESEPQPTIRKHLFFDAASTLSSSQIFCLT